MTYEVKARRSTYVSCPGAEVITTTAVRTCYAKILKSWYLGRTWRNYLETSEKCYTHDKVKRPTTLRSFIQISFPVPSRLPSGRLSFQALRSPVAIVALVAQLCGGCD